MSITREAGLEHPAFAALRLVDEALELLGQANLWSLTETELLELRTGQERAHARLYSSRLAATREIDARGATTRAGAATTKVWLTNALHEHPGEAAREVAVAAALAERLPCTAAALAAGDIGPAAAEVIAATDAALAVSATAAERADAEALLAGHAPRLTHRGLQNAAIHLRHHLDDRRDRRVEKAEQKAVEQSELLLSRRADGTWKLRGSLDPEGGEVLQAALEPLSRPCPGPEGERDPRNAGRRRADALLDLASLALRSGDLPEHGGQPAQVVVTIALDDLQREIGELGPCGSPGLFDDGLPLSAAAVRRLACDAQVVPVVLGSHGEPLDVGRAARTFPLPIRRGLNVRDGGCVFPGCDRAPRWCQAHHIWEWARGGPTDIRNGVLLCPRHHRAVHHEGWTVKIECDGLPSLYPPLWVDPGRRPLRHHRLRPHPGGVGDTGPPDLPR